VLFDPVKAGIIKTLSHPGGNFTGIQLRGSVPKALEWLLSVVPATKHLFVPVRFDTEATKMSLADLKKTARSLGLQVTIAEVKNGKELEAALGAIPEGVDAIFLVNSIFISTHSKEIGAAAIQHKLPTAASLGKCEEGVMISYSARHQQVGKQASRLAYHILRGEEAGDIPAEIVDYSLCVNLKTAREINTALPDTILTEADEIIR